MPAAPEVRFSQCTDTSRHHNPGGGGSVAKVAASGALGAAVGVTVVSCGTQNHTANPHPATYLTGTWNTVVVTGSGGGFAVAAAAEPGGRARMAADATAPARTERRIPLQRMA